MTGSIMPNGHPSSGAAELATIHVTENAGVTVVSVTGEIDISNIDRLNSVFSGLPNSSRGLIVDLADTQYIDSTAVSLLHDLAVRLRERAQRLVVASPLGSPPRRVLDLTALHLTAAVTEDLAAADQTVKDDAGV